MRFFLLSLVVASAFHPMPVFSGRLDFLPAPPLWEAPWADPQEPRMGLMRDEDGFWTGSIGGTRDLVRFGEKGEWSFGLLAGARVLLRQEGVRFPMWANDWKIGAYGARRLGEWESRAEFTHASAHLGDALLGVREPIIYSREFLRFLQGYRWMRRSRVYAGVGWMNHSIPDLAPWFFQLGLEFFTPRFRLSGIPMEFFVAADSRWKQEAGGGWNTDLQAGLRFRRNGKTQRTMRWAFVYENGRNTFGQFFLEKSRRLGIAFFLDE